MKGERRTTDRRVSRTRDALRDALVGLMLDRGWDEIGVQDICDRANIGRSTFYMHFSCKDDLLSSSLTRLRKELQNYVKQSEGDFVPIVGLAHGLIAHAHENRQLFRAVIGKRSSLVVQQRFRQMITDLVKEDVDASDVPRNRRMPTTHYIAGALFELLTWWIDSRSPLKPMELENLFLGMTKSAIGSIVRSNL
jgi:AcrR family transcriptional regulator